MQFKTKTSQNVLRTAIVVLLCLVMTIALGTQAFFLKSGAESYDGKFYTDFDTFEEEQKAAADFNIEIAGEGDVLLKNEGNTLPFDKFTKDISVFGVRSTNIQLGGGGSGGISGAGIRTLQESLTEAGFNLNSRLTGIYKAANTSAEIAPAALKPAYDSYKLFDDAAVIVIGREGSEFSDMATHNAPGNADITKHILELNDNELALVKHVKDNFKKIVVLVNASNPLELGALQDDPAIGAILQIGHPGKTGIMAVGKILNGTVNPSGRLVDIYPADLTKDPTWTNFADNSQVHQVKDKDGKVTGFDSSFNKVLDGKGVATGHASLDYAEGIYMGYRWYETADAEGYYDAYNATSQNSDGYYNRTNGVVYPFGYGLSYTNFTWTINAAKSTAANAAITATTEIKVVVDVKNIGEVAGKDVVQVYYSAPYVDGGIEKSEVDLVEYAKTGLIQPKETEEITITFKSQDMSSFDYSGANAGDHKGYELDPGTYTISLRANSHEVKDNCTLDVKVETSVIEFDTDSVTGNDVNVLFSNKDWNNTLRTTDVSKTAAVFTKRTDLRTPGYLPKTATKDDLTFTDQAIAQLKLQESNDVKDIDSKDTLSNTAYSWVKDAAYVTGWDQATAEEAAARTNGKTAVQLSAMVGKDLDDAKWVDFMNQMTFDELKGLISSTSFSTPALAAIGKPAAKDSDGPAQLSGGTAWASEVVIASTWNVELAEKQGWFVGNESLFIGTNGWYGPAADTHRNPFAGRNFEYYSQDGLQGGKICAAVVKGAQSKGIHTYLKHFFLNDQETDRGTQGGLCTWVTEQAMRQIYGKAFEIAIEEANCNGTMTAFNRFGLMSSASANVYLNLLEGEWGFDGVTVTDMYSKTAWPGNRIARVHTYPLGSLSGTNVLSGSWDEAKKSVVVDNAASPTQWAAVRETAQRMLYVAVNSNVMGNFVPVTNYVDKAIDFTCGTDVKASIALANPGTSDILYSIASGKLPKGVTMNAKGEITGTPTEVGSFKVGVKLLADRYVNKTVNFTFKVAPALKFTATTAKAGAAYSGKMESDVFYIRENDQIATGFDTIEYSIANVDELPLGVVINENGTLEGTPSEAGTFDFTVKVKATRKTIEHVDFGSSSFDRETIKTVETEQQFTLTVSDKDVVSFKVSFSGNYDGAKDNQINVESGKSVNHVANPTREGYTFTGWFSDKECTKTAVLGGEITTDTVFYAGWTPIAANTISTVGMILGIVGILAGAGAIVLIFLKKGATK